MESKQENDNIFRMLILSDLHYERNNSDNFELVISSFIKTLSSFLSENKEWNPQCLGLVGDIAHSAGETSEYDDIHSLIDRIKTEIGVPFQVITVPGNHDKQFPVKYTEDEELIIKGCADEEAEKIKRKALEREASNYKKATMEFLKNYTDKSSESCAITNDFLTKYFKYYALVHDKNK